MEILTRAQFGNPILRKTAITLSVEDIKSSKIQDIIKNMQHTLVEKKLGIGLAAPQVGQDVSLAVIEIKTTKARPEVEEFRLVIINPEIIETFGKKVEQWEGCISAGSNGKADLFAKVPRYKKIKLSYFDQKGIKKEQILDGLKAHVVQHEVDHLNGILFVDKVKNPKTFMTYKEYKKAKRRKLI